MFSRNGFCLCETMENPSQKWVQWQSLHSRLVFYYSMNHTCVYTHRQVKYLLKSGSKEFSGDSC